MKTRKDDPGRDDQALVGEGSGRPDGESGAPPQPDAKQPARPRPHEGTSNRTGLSRPAGGTPNTPRT
jgi:hypothetical protein